MKTLQLALKAEYFDAIRDGSKVEEYRLANDYWHKRLVNRVYDHIVLTRGYPKDGGVEGVTRLTRPWKGGRETVIQHPHFGPDHVSVYAIDVSSAKGGAA